MLIFEIERFYVSRRLVESCNVASRINGSSPGTRYLALMIGTMGLTGTGFEPNLIADSLFLMFGLCMHHHAYPYFGFGLSLPSLQNANEYLPLKKWTIPDADAPLTHEEYREVSSRLSPVAKAKLAEIMDCAGTLTVYDAVNLALLDLQCSKK